MRHDVVVTGMACLCAAGKTPAEVLAALGRGECRLSPATVLDSRALAFPVFALDEECFPGGRRASARDTFALARTVVHKALAQAALPPDLLAGAGLVLGTTAGSALHFLDAYAASRESGKGNLPVEREVRQGCAREDYFSSNLALAMDVATRGPRLTVTNACTSGADAIGLARDMVAVGQCSCVICGGADALSLVPHTGFARLMISSDEACRPFDRERKGLNLGEGAAALVLESAESARQRGAAVLGRVFGYGSAADAHHFTAPHPQGRGLADALGTALAQAGLAAKDLAFVNAHATSTRENDRVEGQLLLQMLPRTPVWASKGGTGHTLGAAGALEAVLTLAALNLGRVPASTGFSASDPEIGLSPTHEALPVSLPYAVSTSLGFGGGNAALVLGRGDA